MKWLSVSRQQGFNCFQPLPYSSADESLKSASGFHIVCVRVGVCVSAARRASGTVPRLASPWVEAERLCTDLLITHPQGLTHIYTHTQTRTHALQIVWMWDYRWLSSTNHLSHIASMRQGRSCNQLPIETTWSVLHKTKQNNQRSVSMSLLCSRSPGRSSKF